jgi:hypothetical protein
MCLNGSVHASYYFAHTHWYLPCILSTPKMCTFLRTNVHLTTPTISALVALFFFFLVSGHILGFDPAYVVVKATEPFKMIPTAMSNMWMEFNNLYKLCMCMWVHIYYVTMPFSCEVLYTFIHTIDWGCLSSFLAQVVHPLPYTGSI